MYRITLLLAIFLAILAVAPSSPASAADIHVDASSTAAAPDGTTWQLSFKFLQDALNLASLGDTIKIAQGVYHPDDTDAIPDSGIRTAFFEMRSEVLILGGFKGLVDLPNADDRDPVLYETILSGDLLDNDNPTLPLDQDTNRGENSLQVVNGGSGLDDLAELNGVTVMGGHHFNVNGSGAGLFIPVGSSPTITNCKFTRNDVPSTFEGGGVLIDGINTSLFVGCQIIDNEAGEGGGMKVEDFATPDIRNCTFERNHANRIGGGGLTVKVGATVTLTDCEFIENSAALLSFNVSIGGGGLLACVNGHAILRRCTFTRNDSMACKGGGISVDGTSDATTVDCAFIENTTDVAQCGAEGGGAIFIVSGEGTQLTSKFVNCFFKDNVAIAGQGGAIHIAGTVDAELTNCLFVGNSANEGGGAYLLQTMIPIVNCTFTKNTALLMGGGMWIFDCGTTLTNCVLWGNTAWRDECSGGSGNRFWNAWPFCRDI